MTVFVTPCIVSSPVTSYRLPAPGFTDVLLNVIVGCFATSKKSAERKCSSRLGSRVSMLAAWIVKLTEEAAGLAWSTCDRPLEGPEAPPSIVKMWRTWKPTVVWALSNV